jgi:hypothetical protein
MRRWSAVPLALAALLAAAAAHAQPYTFRWEAAAGLLPDLGCPFWTLTDNSAAVPSLSGGVLTLATTSTGSNNLYYSDQAPDIIVPNPWILEFRGRYVSGTASSTARSAMMVQASTVANVLTAIAIGPDQVKILSGDFTIGATAAVDTDNAFHTYRIVINGTSLGSAVQVYYDSGLILSGSLYSLAQPAARIVWGESSTLAFGTSEWTYFEHNGSAASCVTAVAPSSWGRIKTLYR